MITNIDGVQYLFDKAYKCAMIYTEQILDIIVQFLPVCGSCTLQKDDISIIPQ